MNRYRTKPILPTEVEAVRITSENREYLRDYCGGKLGLLARSRGMRGAEVNRRDFLRLLGGAAIATAVPLPRSPAGFVGGGFFIAEEMSELITVISPSETPYLDLIGDAANAIYSSVVHRWLEDELS